MGTEMSPPSLPAESLDANGNLIPTLAIQLPELIEELNSTVLELNHDIQKAELKAQWFEQMAAEKEEAIKFNAGSVVIPHLKGDLERDKRYVKYLNNCTLELKTTLETIEQTLAEAREQDANAVKENALFLKDAKVYLKSLQNRFAEKDVLKAKIKEQYDELDSKFLEKQEQYYAEQEKKTKSLQTLTSLRTKEDIYNSDSHHNNALLTKYNEEQKISKEKIEINLARVEELNKDHVKLVSEADKAEEDRDKANEALEIAKKARDDLQV